MLNSYRIHMAGGAVKTFSKEEIIANVEKQIKEGIKPHYKLTHTTQVRGRNETIGWLVWST